MLDLFGATTAPTKRHNDRPETAALMEVKAKSGRLRPEQAVFLERIRAAGGVAFVARDLRDVLDNLKLHKGIKQ